MEAVTLAVATMASILILFVSPVKSLVVYIAVLAFYPSYMSVPIGTVDFTAPRIVIIAIYVKLFMQTRLPSRFRFIWLDRLVIIYFAAQVLAGARMAQSVEALLVNRAGAAFDMALPYFAVRIIMTDKQTYLTLLKSIMVVVAPLALIGLYQCITGNNPFGFFQNYFAWSSPVAYFPQSRSGLFRANVVFAHSIMYGLFFAMFGAVCMGLRHYMKQKKGLFRAGMALMAVGVFSCMSSGPYLAAFFAVLFMLFYRWRQHSKTVLLMLVIMCVTIEVVSNRHFYEVIDRFTFNPVTAWYRSRLIEVGIFQGGMSGHWLTGFGNGVDPMWCTRIDGRNHTDMVNHYLLVLSQFGLVGLIPFFAFNIAALKKLLQAYRASVSHADRWFVWCIMAGLFGLGGAFMSVSLFGQINTVYYMTIAFSGAMPSIVAVRKPGLVTRPVPRINSQGMLFIPEGIGRRKYA